MLVTKEGIARWKDMAEKACGNFYVSKSLDEQFAFRFADSRYLVPLSDFRVAHGAGVPPELALHTVNFWGASRSIVLALAGEIEKLMSERQPADCAFDCHFCRDEREVLNGR